VGVLVTLDVGVRVGVCVGADVWVGVRVIVAVGGGATNRDDERVHRKPPGYSKVSSR